MIAKLAFGEADFCGGVGETKAKDNCSSIWASPGQVALATTAILLPVGFVGDK